MDRDKRHLKILSQIQILFGIFNLFVSFYYYETFFFLFHRYRKALEDTNPDTQVGLLIGFGFILFLIGIAILFFIILAGQSLARYENYNICRIVALAECLIFPVGTIIGVSTILVLRRDSVKQLFSTPKEESADS